MTAEAAARKEMMEHSATTNPDSHAAPVQPAMAPAFVEQSRISASECKDFHESCDFRTDKKCTSQQQTQTASTNLVNINGRQIGTHGVEGSKSNSSPK